MSIDSIAATGEAASLLPDTSVGGENSTFSIGETIFIRTVTYHAVGRVTKISRCGINVFLHLERASWVAVSGRFHVMLAKGTISQSEPCQGEIRINVNSFVDVFPWPHSLPNKPNE